MNMLNKIKLSSVLLVIGFSATSTLTYADATSDLVNRCMSIPACKQAVNAANAAVYDAACASIPACAQSPAYQKYIAATGGSSATVDYSIPTEAPATEQAPPTLD